MNQYTLMLAVSSSVCLVMLLAYWGGCLWRKFSTRNDDSCDEFGLPWVSTETPMPKVKLPRVVLTAAPMPMPRIDGEWVLDTSNIIEISMSMDGVMTKFYGWKFKKKSPYRYC